MTRTVFYAAALAAFIALAAPAPTQASVLNPELATVYSKIVQNVQYLGPYQPYRYGPARYWDCWHERVRVRSHHRWAWRTVRRCGWRLRSRFWNDRPPSNGYGLGGSSSALYGGNGLYH
jgi:hypothetical protein